MSVYRSIEITYISAVNRNEAWIYDFQYVACTKKTLMRHVGYFNTFLCRHVALNE